MGAKMRGVHETIQPSLRRDPLFWLTLVLTIFAIAPFLQPGYHWGANDARHHVYFLFEFDRVVQDGIWLPRWSPDFAFGYGYPFFNIYGPLSHFVGELFHYFLGFSFVTAVETVFALSIVGSAATMYGFVRAWGGRAAAVVSALVYVYAPYHLLNLYVRANLAESMAFVWLPLCLWTARQCVLTPSLRWVMGLAIAYAALMLTSPLVISLFTPLLTLYILVLLFVYATPAATIGGTVDLMMPAYVRLWLVVRRGLAPGIGGILGLGLCAFFWIPAFTERQFVLEEQWFDGRYDFRGNFVYFFQLFSPQWGFGVSQLGPDDVVGFQIGAVALSLALLGVVLAWQAIGKLRWEMGTFIAAGSIATLLGLTIAEPLWDMQIPVVTTVLRAAQFPWRWFNVTCLCVSILAGLLMHPAVTRAQEQPFLTLPLLTVIAVILLGSYPMLRVEIVEPAEGPVSLAGLMRFQQSSDEMTGSTVYVQGVENVPKWSDMADQYIAQDAAGGPITPVDIVDYSIMNYDREVGFTVNLEAQTSISAEVWYWSGRDDARIIFNHFYYPGWKAYLLNERHGVPIKALEVIPEAEGIDRSAEGKVPFPPGRMGVPVPKGEGYVLLRFEDTPVRVLGQNIALATLVVMLMIGIVDFIQRRRRM